MVFVGQPVVSNTCTSDNFLLDLYRYNFNMRAVCQFFKKNMPKVIVKRTDKDLGEAMDSCPVGAFKKNGNEYVINPGACVDCGVCQSLVGGGVILDSDEAEQSDIDYNEKNSL
ncbi:MAG: hypothetical protein LBS34_02125 [Rickettsiales bacterium]|jgi:ferredoxin|nr:hypothetical protein [Rickettsiales bacterium]